MSTRVFGAIKGAGTQVRDTSAAKPAVPGPFGTSIAVGIFRSGPTDKFVKCEDVAQFHRVYGEKTQDSQAPIAVEDFFEASRGAAPVYVLRVTHGDEMKAALRLFSRNVCRSVIECLETSIFPEQVIVLKGANGGRWAGREKRLAGDAVLPGALLTGTTFSTGLTMLEDEWKGAILTFPNDDSSGEYLVTGNTAAGVITVESTWASKVYGGSDGRWNLELLNENELTGRKECLAIEVGDGGEDPLLGFSLFCYRDDASVKSWENGTFDSSSSKWWYAQVHDDVDNYEVEATEEAFLGGVDQELTKPANYAEIPAPNGVSDNEVTFQIVRWQHNSAAGTPYLDTVNDLTWGSDPRPCLIELTTLAGGATYSVAVTFPDGTQIAGLPSGSWGVAYGSQHKWLPGWNVRAGVNPAQGEKVTIYVRPLPPDLASMGAWFYPFAVSADGDVRTRYRVASNSYKTVTLSPSVDLDGVVLPPGEAKKVGTVAGPWVLAGGETVILTTPGRAAFTITNTLAGPAITASALAAELNARELARVMGVAADKVVLYEADSTNHLTIKTLQDFGNEAMLTIGAGTLNPVVGLGAPPVTGTKGTICRLQWRQEMTGGYDGIALLDAGDDYGEAFAISGSPLNELLEENTGLCLVMLPGVTDADAQAAAMRWCYQYNAVFVAEIPDTEDTENEAIAWHEANLAIGPEQDYHRCLWPSYGLRPNPFGTGWMSCTVSGAFLGVKARKAVENGGYHEAAANTDYLVSPIFKALLTGDRRLDNEKLNAYGLIELRKRGSLIYPYGDRVPGYGGRVWAHERDCKSHIGRVLLTQTTSLVFKAINAANLARAKALARELFLPWYRSGWFDDTDGPAFEDQVGIKADATNNPATEKALGNLHVDCSFQIVGTAERVIFSIGPKGVVAA